ncbi:hypothetical protein D6T64_14090 [Cryobacterium melibiosiphilum]|uniref:Glycerophosphoryl diester phosphodiesterase membrane domain-containing protein n=1 Tax=Cryobacterium melibiosiphilum TaxID=995039 RepID=A0A3A5MN43_9MICO|nr:hypothetical protein D6T64_14090 [Cryobacterium melibiosiphilum]
MTPDAYGPPPAYAPATGYGPPPGYAPAGYYPGPGGPPPAWAPPPKPGLIPLRPLNFGTLLWAPFQVLRRNPRATFGSALLIQSVLTFVTVIVVGLVTAWSLGRIDSAPAGDVEAVTAGATLTIILSVLVPLALQLIGSALLQGVIVVEVARATLGQKLTLRALWRIAGRRLWVLVLWTVILVGVLLIAVAVLAGLVTVLVLLGDGFVALGVIVGIFGGLGLLALGLWLSTKTSLVPSLIVLEHLSIRSAVLRSWRLTRGYFWRTLGIQLLVALIVSIVAQIVTTPLSLIFTYAIGLVDPNAAMEAYIPSVILYILTLFIALIFGAVAAVVQSATTVLIYLDLRMRTEGLDLELQRFVESAQAGGSVADPYLVPPTSRPTA